MLQKGREDSRSGPNYKEGWDPLSRPLPKAIFGAWQTGSPRMFGRHDFWAGPEHQRCNSAPWSTAAKHKSDSTVWSHSSEQKETIRKAKEIDDSSSVLDVCSAKNYIKSDVFAALSIDHLSGVLLSLWIASLQLTPVCDKQWVSLQPWQPL